MVYMAKRMTTRKSIIDKKKDDIFSRNYLYEQEGGRKTYDCQ